MRGMRAMAYLLVSQLNSNLNTNLERVDRFGDEYTVPGIASEVSTGPGEVQTSLSGCLF